LKNNWDQYLDQLEFAYNNIEHASHGKMPFMAAYWQPSTTMDDALAGPPPDTLEPPAVQDLLDASARSLELGHYSIPQMNARMVATDNYFRCDV
jgi:hypothetical protein